MDKTFNELFDDFFKRNDIKPEDKIDEAMKDDAKKMIDLLTRVSNIDTLNEDDEKEIDAELGKPDIIEFFNDGNVFFEKRTWKTPNGDLIKLIVTDEPSLNIAPRPSKSLEAQLQEAVEAEQFEKAAAIRDEIKKEKNSRK